MKGFYSFVKRFLLNGFYAYALFGFYSVTISPFITKFISFGTPDTIVGVFGFLILIAELPAIYFKLKMVRIRKEQRKLAYKNETGESLIPRTAIIIFFGVFMRIALRVVVIMVSSTALGYVSTERLMSPAGLIILIAGIFIDICWLGYIYMTTGFYQYDAYTRDEWIKIKQETKAWNEKYLPLAATPEYYWKELISDFVLQIFGLMVFTAYWTYINSLGMEMINHSYYNGASAFNAAVDVFSMQFFVTAICLMPMRIAYWLEDSIMAVSKKEKYIMWLLYLLVMIYTCIPTILKFLAVYIFKTDNALNFKTTTIMNFTFSLILMFIVLIIQVVVFRKEIRSSQPEPEPEI